MYQCFDQIRIEFIAILTLSFHLKNWPGIYKRNLVDGLIIMVIFTFPAIHQQIILAYEKSFKCKTIRIRFFESLLQQF